MKRLISILLVAIMVVSLAISAAAAGGINKDEAALLAKFYGVVDSYAYLSARLAFQYKNQAENALAKVDLDPAACADLSAAIDAVVGYARANGINTVEAARRALPTVLGMVNGVAGKYGISVYVAFDGSVCVSLGVNGTADKAASTAKIVKQTGVDMTATYAVIGVLFVALVCGLAVVSKKNLLVKN